MTFPDVAPSGGSFTTAADGRDGLVDGTLTATPTFTVPGQSPFVGATLTIAKDVVAPDGPVAYAAGWHVRRDKSVRLGDDDATAAIHYTMVGTPGAASPTFGLTPIAVDHTLTIRAIAIDPAGNVSPEASFTYTFTGQPAPPAPRPERAGRRSSSRFRSCCRSLPGQAGQSVQAVTATSLPAVRGLSVAVLHGHALRVGMRLGRGAGVVRLRVFRTSHGRATGGPVLSTLRLPLGRRPRTCVTLRGHALRALRPGARTSSRRAPARAPAGTGRRPASGSRSAAKP